MRETQKRRRPRAPLSRERVLAAALQVADEGGIEALSMRRLARELGVEAMSLYNHVEGKDAILSGILELIANEIELPPSPDDWKDAIRRSAISARDVFLEHRWASGLWLSRRSGGPAQLRRTDWMLRTLREAGLPSELTYHALHILEAYILGATVQNLSFPYKGEELAGLAGSFLAQLPAEDYPDLVEHVKQHLDPPGGGKGGFELGLDLILDGLERTLPRRLAGTS